MYTLTQQEKSFLQSTLVESISNIKEIDQDDWLDISDDIDNLQDCLAIIKALKLTNQEIKQS